MGVIWSSILGSDCSSQVPLPKIDVPELNPDSEYKYALIRLSGL